MAVAVGLTLGIATLSMSALVAVKDSPILGLLVKAIIPILIPGLIAAVFSSSMWIGSIVNAVFYFVLASIAGILWQRSLRKPPVANPPPADPLS